MTSPTIDIEALKAGRRAELARIIDAYAARTLDIVSLMIRGDVTKDARTEANERAQREALDAILASDASLIARTEAAEGEVERLKVENVNLRIAFDMASESREAFFRQLKAAEAQRDRLVEEVQATRELLGRAMEELRLIRAKDCGAVYDTLIRTDAHAKLMRVPDALSATTPEQSA